MMMDSYWSPFSSSTSSSSFTNTSVVESERPKSKLDAQNSFSSGMGVRRAAPNPMVENDGAGGGFMGVLEVHIHQARDIHNICIYHKQDVYAKVCLTSDPDVTVQTKTINGGGKNPVFNETLRLDVRTIDSSLKCEIWMLSRVKNYLEDQLLGFALVPLSDVIVAPANGKLPQEFSLSSTDLFHSPAGFVQMSLSYAGSSPEVLAIAAPPASSVAVSPNGDTLLGGSEADANSLPTEFDKIEFPDLKVVNENQLMVSEYFGIPCADLESESNESLGTSDNGDHLTGAGVGVQVQVEVGENVSSPSVDSVPVLKSDSPPSSVSTNGSPSAPVAASSHSASGPLLGVSSSSSKLPPPPPPPATTTACDNASSDKEKQANAAEGEADSSGGAPSNSFAPSVLNMKIEPEKSVVQQEIVDLYMKSMQQFTESLAKMKLPMDVENGSPNKENGSSSSDQKLQAAKGNGSKVFYGSRAFF